MAHRGFTLLELMVVLAIAVILGALAMPNMRDFAQSSRMTTQTNDLIADLNLARSEAIKRGALVVICRSANSTVAVPTCDTAAPHRWENGWIIFEDAVVAGANNQTYLPANNDRLISVRGPTQGQITLRGNGTSLDSIVAFLKSGFTTLPMVAVGTTPHHFKICDVRGDTKARGIVIDTTGRARVVRKQTFAALTCP